MRGRTLTRLLGVAVLVLIAFEIAFQPLTFAGGRPRFQSPRVDMNLGLDLKGGSRIVLEARPSKTAAVTPDRVDAVKRVIENRIDQLGVVEPTLQRQGNDRIVVELPGIQDVERARRILGATAQLEFVDTGRTGVPDGACWTPDGEHVIVPGGTLAGDALRRACRSSDTSALPKTQAVTLQKKVVLTGADLSEARPEPDPQNPARWHVAFAFRGDGAKALEQHTGTHIGQYLTILLDNRVISSPVIQAKLEGGRGVITGNFTAESAGDLATLLRGGALPLPVEIIEERTVGPTLGRDSLEASIRAGTIAAILVALFMVANYALPGVLAVLALAVYTLVTLALLRAIGATMTLPGIAGFILSVGIAIDANVLIFERIKDELRNSKSVRTAIDVGWNRALSAIIDSNVTTIIGAVVLFWLGTGPVKGFAVTVTLGVLVSLLTSIFVTRVFVNAASDIGWQNAIRSVLGWRRAVERA